MKKTLFALLAIMAVFATSFTLTSCDNDYDVVDTYSVRADIQQGTMRYDVFVEELSKFKSFEYSTTCTKGDAIDRFRNTVDLIDAGLQRRVEEMYGYGYKDFKYILRLEDSRYKSIRTEVWE